MLPVATVVLVLGLAPPLLLVLLVLSGAQPPAQLVLLLLPVLSGAQPPAQPVLPLLLALLQMRLSLLLFLLVGLAGASLPAAAALQLLLLAAQRFSRVLPQPFLLAAQRLLHALQVAAAAPLMLAAGGAQPPACLAEPHCRHSCCWSRCSCVRLLVWLMVPADHRCYCPLLLLVLLLLLVQLLLLLFVLLPLVPSFCQSCGWSCSCC